MYSIVRTSGESYIKKEYLLGSAPYGHTSFAFFRGESRLPNSTTRPQIPLMSLASGFPFPNCTVSFVGTSTVVRYLKLRSLTQKVLDIAYLSTLAIPRQARKIRYLLSEDSPRQGLELGINPSK